MKPDTFNARVTHLVARAEAPEFRITEDAPDKRIKIQFQLEPPPDIKRALVKYGFRYRAGSTAAWCRKLDEHGRRAARVIAAMLSERTPEDNQ